MFLAGVAEDPGQKPIAVNALDRPGEHAPDHYEAAVDRRGDVVDMRMDFELPPLKYETIKHWPTGKSYTATRADGTIVNIGDPNPPNRGNIMRRRAESDASVPITSAEALFPGQHHRVKVGSNYTKKKQFRITGAEHDAICHHRDCMRALFDIMEHLLGQ